MKEKWLSFELCLSSRCDRYCSHCSMNATINGKDLSLENARILSREMKKQDLYFYLQLTGEGEALLNPNMVKIMDLIIGENKKVEASFVTSGVRRKEVPLFEELLRRPYIDRINFAVSFNQFGKGFAKRLTRTLDMIFQTKIEEVSVKVCFPNYFRKVFCDFDDVITEHFSRWPLKRNPLLDHDDISHPVIDEKEIFKGVPWFVFEEEQEKVIKLVEKLFTGVRLDKGDLSKEAGFLLSNLGTKVQFETENGRKSIVFMPHPMSNMGRAQLLNKKFHIKFDTYLCYFLRDIGKTIFYVGPDGYAYPSPYCPKKKEVCLGHIKDGLQALQKKTIFRKDLLLKVLADRTDRSICSICSS